MPDAVFIETTIPSYYVARPSRNLVQLARQELTREWWDFRRTTYDLYTSQVVLDEAADGDATMGHERVKLLHGIPLLDVDDEVSTLAEELIRRSISRRSQPEMPSTSVARPFTECSSSSHGTASISPTLTFASESALAFHNTGSTFL